MDANRDRHPSAIDVLILSFLMVFASAIGRNNSFIFLLRPTKLNFTRPINKMKYTLSIFLVIIIIGMSYGQHLEEIRKRFHQAVLSTDSIENYHKFIKKAEDTSPAVMAYRAAGEAMMAQTLWNPLAKLSQVHRYEKMILQAVEKDMDNLEIRFLRFAIEFYLPRILMMSNHLEEDRDFIIANLWRCKAMNIDPEFERYITYFMNETGMLLPEQITVIKQLLSEPGTD